MGEQLKPCPFCGGEELRSGDTKFHFGTDIFIRCTNCGAKIQIAEEFGDKKLIDSWNRRAYEQN